METGYDYALLGRPARRRAWVFPVVSTLFLMAILISAVFTAAVTKANVQTEAAPAEVAEAGPAVPVSPPNRPDASTGAAGYTGPRIPAPDSAIAGQQLYPADSSEADHWVNPLAHEP